MQNLLHIKTDHKKVPILDQEYIRDLMSEFGRDNPYIGRMMPVIDFFNKLQKECKEPVPTIEIKLNCTGGKWVKGYVTGVYLTYVEVKTIEPVNHLGLSLDVFIIEDMNNIRIL